MNANLADAMRHFTDAMDALMRAMLADDKYARAVAVVEALGAARAGLADISRGAE